MPSRRDPVGVTRGMAAWMLLSRQLSVPGVERGVDGSEGYARGPTSDIGYMDGEAQYSMNGVPLTCPTWSTGS
jgi:hypothetical protein